MIIEFSLGNFRSFKEVETLSMIAAPIHSKNKEIDKANVHKVNNKLILLNSKALYGANASGKSNVIKAFVSFKRLIRSSIKDENVIKQACDDFVLDGNFNKKPVFYQLIFLNSNIIYRYGFEVMENKIVSEWLYKKPELKREVELFTREVMKVAVSTTQFNEAKKFEDLTESGDSDIFQSNSLFLSATAAVGVKLSKEIQQTIGSIDIAMNADPGLRLYSTNWWLNEFNRKRGIRLLKAADTGVEEIGITEHEINVNNFSREMQELYGADIPRKIPRLTSIRRVFREGVPTDIAIETLFDSFESEGTKKFSYLVPVILEALEAGNTIWIDEFDAGIHPRLTKKIVDLFHSSDTNPHGAQLIFATHDTNLLKSSFLRRDQICFVEKNKERVSHLKTLVEYKGIRNDASYDKDYLQGRYGAVPFLNELDEAVENGITSNA